MNLDDVVIMLIIAPMAINYALGFLAGLWAF